MSVISQDRYVRRSYPFGDWFEDLNGVLWYEAEVPSRWHRCRPQSRALASGDLIERCACGAIRFHGIRPGRWGPWVDRNSREPLTDAERAEIARGRQQQKLIDEFDGASPARQAEIWQELRRMMDEEDGAA